MSSEPMNAGTNQTGKTVEIEKSKASLAENETPMTLEQVRADLKGKTGPKFWRSVDELQNTPEFQAAVEKEFPSAAQEWIDPVTRRGFLKVMGASMALAGLAGCTKQPDEPIYPYVKAPEDLLLGKPNYFAKHESAAYRRRAPARQDRPVSPRQGRWQSRPRLQPRFLGCLLAGLAARPLRSRPLAACHIRRRE